MVPYEVETVVMQQEGQGEMSPMDVSSGGRRGSSRDAAGTQRRALPLMYPLREPHALGAWMGVQARAAPGTPRGRGELPLPRVPLARVMAAPMPPLPLPLPPPPVHGVMVAVDAFDLEEGIATEMGLGPETTVLGRAEPPLQP